MSIGNTTRTKIANFAPMDYERFFSADVPSFLRSPVREIFRKVDLQAICSFAGGYPAAVTFPTDQIPGLAAAVLEKYGTRALQYGATQGVPELRAAIAARYGVPVSQVQITTSSQQGIDVCSRVFLDPGDIVLAQSPVYLGALQSFRAYRAEVRDMPSGACPPPDKCRGRGPLTEGTDGSLLPIRHLWQWEGPEGAKRPESPVMVLPAISIDTYRPEIVERAYEIIGPFIVNDVGGGTPDMLRTVGELGLPYIAMHGRKPQGDVIEDILGFFRDFAVRAEANGINDWILDPGFGFGKDIDQNYEVLNRLDELKKAGRDILVGISRKSMIYKKLGITPEEAMPETLALERIALEKGATWLRVHDVAETVQMVRDYSTMYTSSPGAAK